MFKSSKMFDFNTFRVKNLKKNVTIFFITTITNYLNERFRNNNNCSLFDTVGVVKNNIAIFSPLIDLTTGETLPVNGNFVIVIFNLSNNWPKLR